MDRILGSARRLAHILNAGLVVLSVGGSLWVFPSLPAEIPRHFNLVGTADAYWSTTYLHWLFLPLVGVALTGLIYAIAWIGAAAMRPGGQAGRLGTTLDRRSQDERSVAAVRVYLYWTATGMLVLFGTIQWGAYRVATTSARALPPLVLGTSIVVIGAVLGGAGWLTWWRATGRRGGSEETGNEQSS